MTFGGKMLSRRKKMAITGTAAVISLALVTAAPVKDTVIGLVKYRECFNPGGSGAKTIALGDSITKGHSLGWMGASDSYYDIMGCWGEVGYAGNAGRWFETTDQILTRVDADVVSKHPQRVLVLAGTNDIRRGDTSRSLANLTAMRDKFKAAGIESVFGTLPPSEDRKAETQDFNAQLRTWAAAEGVQLIDYWTPLADKDGTYKPGLHSDPIHPSPTGAKIMAEVAAESLR